jgi:Fungal specific transcription factor domain
MDGPTNIPFRASEETVQRMWEDWTELHSFSRLLAACFVLDSRHALLFGRLNHAADPITALDLFLPCDIAIWDMLTAAKWAQAVRARGKPTETINQFLDKVDGSNNLTCDRFQSALVIACYSTATTIQLNNAHGYLPPPLPTHHMFEPCQHEMLAKTLAQHESIQIMHRAVQLRSLVPFRALIATAGESWFFSRKLAGDSKIAVEEFKKLKAQLHHWSTGSVDTTGFIPTGTTSFYNAVSVALQIVQTAVSTSSAHISLSFGPELAVYLATIVLWSAVFAGLKQARASGRHSIQIDSYPAEWEPLRAENLIKEFLPCAINDVNEALTNATTNQQGAQALSTPSQNLDLVVGIPVSMPVTEVFPLVEAGSPYASLAFPPAKMLDFWMTGVGSVIRWTAFVLGGSGQRQNGAGEMIEGTIVVLEKLGRTAWVRSWF